MQDQAIIVSLHAVSYTVACPQCGTAGSRIHSRDPRTIVDLAFGGRSLTLKLLVRKWICPEALCSQHIFAERFPEVVQRYARMTDRLIKALQSIGVLTNGADAAQIVSSCGMPTTAKTIIRRISQRADYSGRRSQFAQCLSCPRTRNASTAATTISLFFHR